MIDKRKIQINRTIIHRVFKKKEDEDYGYAECSDNLIDFGVLELETLKERISTAFSKNKRFFKLEIARSGHATFFDFCHDLHECDNSQFIEKSKGVADLMGTSHDKRTIPGGLLIFMDGTYDQGNHFVLVIKAELQEAFTIKDVSGEKLVELINDLFLSPAKDFYKIGYLIKDQNADSTYPNDSYSAFMYDDNFSSGKKDLAEYFYNKFLGFTTDKNDKLLNKNWYTDVSRFIENNVLDFDNKKGLRNALNVMMRENTTGIINPQEFAVLHFDPDLLRRYETEVGTKYPTSFNKDLSLVDRKLQRGKIALVEELKIEGPTDSLENVDVINGNNVDIDALRMSIENGDIRQIVTIRTNRL